ncbi:unnamed protein product, partial [Owenia fusiformis]
LFQNHAIFQNSEHFSSDFGHFWAKVVKSEPPWKFLKSEPLPLANPGYGSVFFYWINNKIGNIKSYKMRDHRVIVSPFNFQIHSKYTVTVITVYLKEINSMLYLPPKYYI